MGASETAAFYSRVSRLAHLAFLDSLVSKRSLPLSFSAFPRGVAHHVVVLMHHLPGLLATRSRLRQPGPRLAVSCARERFPAGSAGCREGVRRRDRVAASLACVQRSWKRSTSLIRSTCPHRRTSAPPLLSGWPRNGTRTGFKSESRLALRNRRCLEAVFLLNDGKNKLDRRPQDT